jgi:hypothetical protein
LDPNEVFFLAIVKLAFEGMFERMSYAPRQVDIYRRHHCLISGLGNVDNAGQGVLCVLQPLDVPNERENSRLVGLRETARYLVHILCQPSFRAPGGPRLQRDKLLCSW